MCVCVCVALLYTANWMEGDRYLDSNGDPPYILNFLNTWWNKCRNTRIYTRSSSSKVSLGGNWNTFTREDESRWWNELLLYSARGETTFFFIRSPEIEYSLESSDTNTAFYLTNIYSDWFYRHAVYSVYIRLLSNFKFTNTIFIGWHAVYCWLSTYI